MQPHLLHSEICRLKFLFCIITLIAWFLREFNWNFPILSPKGEISAPTDPSFHVLKVPISLPRDDIEDISTLLSRMHTLTGNISGYLPGTLVKQEQTYCYPILTTAALVAAVARFDCAASTICRHRRYQLIYPAGQAGHLMDACNFIFCCYWLTFLIASRCIWNFFMVWLFLDWLDFIIPF